MAASEVSQRIRYLQRAIADKQRNISVLTAQINSLEELRHQARLACEEANSFIADIRRIKVSQWRGVHANEFRSAMADGGCVKQKAKILLNQCQSLEKEIAAKLATSQQDCSSLKKGLAQDNRALQQAQKQLQRHQRGEVA